MFGRKSLWVAYIRMLSTSSKFPGLFMIHGSHHFAKHGEDNLMVENTDVMNKRF